MATRKTQTKAALAASTAQSNNMPTLWDATKIANTAVSAFNAKEEGDKQLGTAVQSLASCIMALWLNWRNSGHPENEEVKDLRMILGTDDASKSALNSLRQLMSGAIIGAAPDTTDWTPDQLAEMRTKRTAKLALLTRAMRPAAILLSAGVDLGSFNTGLGVFMVVPNILFLKGTTPVGIAAKSDPVALNNRGLAGTKDDNGAFVKIKASIDQLERAYRSNNNLKGGRVTTPPATVDLKKVKADKLATNVPVEELVKALHIVFCVKGDGDPVTQDSFPVTVWNMLSDIAMTNDEIQNAPEFKANISKRAKVVNG